MTNMETLQLTALDAPYAATSKYRTSTFTLTTSQVRVVQYRALQGGWKEKKLSG